LVSIESIGGVARVGTSPSLLLVDQLDGGWWIEENVSLVFDSLASSPLSKCVS
jgi:hypothetical protein